MTTDAKGQEKRTRPRDRGRVPYRFTARQVLKMVKYGIIKEDVELWDGVIYKMTKGELHNTIVMATAEAFRAVVSPEAYHVREEKSNSDGAFSLPEPDVAVARGPSRAARPGPPPLEQVALVVEVDHHTARADRVDKFSRYAARGIPVYWIIRAKRREVLVHDTPQGTGDSACYANTRTFTGVEAIPIVIDGKEVGRVAVPDLFPVEKAP